MRLEYFSVGLVICGYPATGKHEPFSLQAFLEALDRAGAQLEVSSEGFWLRDAVAIEFEELSQPPLCAQESFKPELKFMVLGD